MGTYTRHATFSQFVSMNIQCSRIFFANDLPTGKWPPQIPLPALVTHLPTIITVRDIFCRILNAFLIDSENLPVYSDLDLISLIMTDIMNQENYFKSSS